jgi:hypothetical protein
MKARRGGKRVRRKKLRLVAVLCPLQRTMHEPIKSKETITSIEVRTMRVKYIWWSV